MRIEEEKSAKQVVEDFFEPKRKQLLSGDIMENRLEKQVKEQFLRLITSLSKDMTTFAIKKRNKEQIEDKCSKEFDKLKRKFLKTFDLNDKIMILPYTRAIETITKM